MLAALLSVSPDLLILCDRQGIVREPAELAGQRWSHLVREFQNVPGLEDVLTSGQAWDGEVEVRATGKTLHCGCRMVPIVQADGTIDGALITLHDPGVLHRIEESLRRSEEQYRLLAENSTDLISRHDPTGVYLYASPACRTLVGFEPEELLGHSAYEFIHPEDLQGVVQAHAQIFEGLAPPRITFRARHKNGSYQWFETSMRTVLDPVTSKLVEIQCSSRDVTARVEVERSLRESRALLQAIVDYATAVIYVKDAGFRYLLINRRYEQLFNVTSDWVLGRTDYELLPPDKVDALRANDRQVFETGEPMEIEELVPHGNQIHAYLSVKFPIRRPDGTVFAVGGISSDITRRKQAEEALQQQSTILRMVLDSMAEAVLVADEQRRIYLFNPAAERFFGLSSADVGRVIGYRPAYLYHPDLVTPMPESERPLERSLRGEEVNDCEVFVQLQPPREGVWGLVNGRPLLDPEGRSRGAVIVYRDITERKRIDQQLRDQNTQLEETIRSEREAHRALKEAESHLIQAEKLSSLGQTVAGVAHEINNPLSYVSNNIAVLKRDLELVVSLLGLYQQGDETLARHQPELHQRIADQIERYDLTYAVENLDGLITRSTEGLKRIQQIVKDLRTFARVEEGVMQVVNLNESIVSTVNIIRGRAREMSVELELDLATIPLVFCNESRISQVVLNLVANAIDASTAGGKVIIRSRVAGDFVEIHVIDHGEGIDPKIRSKIFDPFFTTKPVGRGTGLGLSISYGIIRDHQGELAVESESGRGSQFTIRLPLHPRALPDDSRLSDAAAGSGPTPS